MSVLTDRLRVQLECWHARYESRLEDVAACVDDGMPAALTRLSDAASVCNQLAQLLHHQECKEKQIAAKPASEALS